jgi:uncharacterized damage-inducible protein DinB
MPNRRPDPSEHAPYYGKYISLVPGDDPVAALQENLRTTSELLESIGEEQSNASYAAGKWSMKQLLGHLNDAERIFSYRATRISRGDETPLPGFEQEDYINNFPFESLRWADLVAEYKAIRQSSLALLTQLPKAAWERRGTASNAPVSVLAVAYIMAGHELHHVKILRERYLGKTTAA